MGEEPEVELMVSSPIHKPVAMTMRKCKKAFYTLFFMYT